MRAIQRVNGVIQKFESHGYTVDITERRLPYTYVTKDMFGVSDLMAVDDESTVLIQVTTQNLVQKHIREYQSNADIMKFMHTWLKHGDRYFIFAGWAKVKIGWELRLTAASIVTSKSGTPILTTGPCSLS